jgi:hypothetical protein
MKTKNRLDLLRGLVIMPKEIVRSFHLRKLLFLQWGHPDAFHASIIPFKIQVIVQRIAPKRIGKLNLSLWNLARLNFDMALS